MLCPTCKKPAVQEQNPSFPFCGDRCKLIDLGRWLDGAYQIPVNEDSEENQRHAEDSDPSEE